MLHRPNEAHVHCIHDVIQPREVTTTFSICVRCHLYDIVREISLLACSLVFSDWHLGLRKISHRRLATGGDRLSQDAFDLFLEVYADHGREEVQRPPNIFLLEHIPLAKDLAAICSGSSRSEDLIQSNQHKFLGLDIDGVLMISTWPLIKVSARDLSSSYEKANFLFSRRTTAASGRFAPPWFIFIQL